MKDYRNGGVGVSPELRAMEEKASPNLGQPFNPEVDEATAVAVTILINNHIEQLKVWRRKLKDPYMAKSYLYYHQAYPKPTLASMLLVQQCAKMFELDLLKIMLPFTKAAKDMAGKND